MIPQLVTVPVAAERLAVDRSTLYRLIRAGKIPVVRITDGAVRIREDDLAAYIESRRGVAPAQTGAMLLHVPVRRR